MQQLGHKYLDWLDDLKQHKSRDKIYKLCYDKASYIEKEIWK